jgi:hypothetical protein
MKDSQPKPKLLEDYFKEVKEKLNKGEASQQDLVDIQQEINIIKKWY